MPRIAQLCKMAEELLRAKQDYKELDKNRSEKFYSCNPVLQSKYSRKFHQERFLAQNRNSIQEWFNFYLSINAQYNILNKNIYNMDENSYIMGISRSSKLVFSKYQKQAFINQVGNRDST